MLPHGLSTIFRRQGAERNKTFYKISLGNFLSWWTLSFLAELALATEYRRIESHPVTRCPLLHLVADGFDDPGRLVAHDDRGNPPPAASVHPVHVTPADATGVDPDEDVSGSDLRLGRVAVSKLFVMFEGESFHRRHRTRIFDGVQMK